MFVHLNLHGNEPNKMSAASSSKPLWRNQRQQFAFLLILNKSSMNRMTVLYDFDGVPNCKESLRVSNKNFAYVGYFY